MIAEQPGGEPGCFVLSTGLRGADGARVKMLIPKLE
jgi:hypothetical protein